MPWNEGGEIILLQETNHILREITTFFVGDDERAVRARNKLGRKHKESRKHDKESEAFYANVLVDLESLGEILHGIPESWSDELGAVCGLLTVIQDDFLVKEDASDHEDSSVDDDDDDDVAEDHGLFAQLKKFHRDLRDEHYGPKQGSRIDWFCKRTKFEDPKHRKTRESLIEALRSCQAELKPYARSRPLTDLSWRRNENEDTEYAPAGDYFQLIDRLHEYAAQHLDCQCFGHTSHRNAKFSFDITSVAAPGSVVGVIRCPTDDPQSSSWKHAHLHFQEQNGSPTAEQGRGDALKSYHQISRRAGPALKRSEQRSSSSALCEVLTASRNGDLVRLGTSKPKLQNARDGPYTLSKSGPAVNGDSALADCYDLPPNHALLRMKPKYRLILSLQLAYAYLHLGGGSWWPYDKKPCLHWIEKSSYEIPNSNDFFFTPTFSPRRQQDQTREDSSRMLKACNAAMPCLPAFGKLLLELFVGKKVTWESLDSDIESARDDACAEEILLAVNTCLAFGDDKTLAEGGTIRDEKPLRDHFLKEVVLRLQYVLRFAYKVNVHDIFRPSNTGYVVELHQGPGPQGFLSSESESPTPPREGFCLHDGDAMDEISDIDKTSARSYIRSLQECANIVMRDKISTRPIKIAILDTGAHIPRTELDHLYDDRIKECRSWLTSLGNDGDIMDGPSSDPDGHGTHGTGVLLEATQGTGIEVYVGQIFDKRSEKVKQDTILDDRTVMRISKAIRYAVDSWKVDIISMSFGFPEPVDEIVDAIEHAHSKRVLMLAAASNCGGNDRPSWPARDEHVMCIHAADGNGNKYAKNPTPASNKDNFAVLGHSVEALWPPDRRGNARWIHKSGTSTATPVSAAIAGLVMTLLRQAEDRFLQQSDLKNARRVQKRLKALGRASHMATVFRLMVGNEGTRDGYHYVFPGKIIHRKGQEEHYMVERILQSIDA